MKFIMLMAAVVFLTSCAIFQRPLKSGVKTVSIKTDTLKNKPDTTALAGKPKPYSQIITNKAISDKGLFTVHRIDNKYFFEIQDSLLDRDILVVNRIVRAAAGYRPGQGEFGYAGDEIGENVIRFCKGPGYKIFIKRMLYIEFAKDTSTNGLSRAVNNSNLQAIVASFDIKAVTPDSSGSVIEVTDYLSQDNDLLFFDANLKKNAYKLGGILLDRSYISSVSSFSINLEIKTVKTYATEKAPITYELNSSVVLLPKQLMKPRYSDKRVGYFQVDYYDYDVPQSVKVNGMITRWRLEPKEEDTERYKRGELVEPKKPIVYYIDPATPKKWVSYLIQGVNDWQKTFEKIGFKNAIYALEAPINDSDWNLYDAAHNAIVYKASPVANASGPSITDPRTGEILETHINWYHNVMELIHDWYMIQAGPSDSRARKMEFDDSLMGQLIRFVSSHEVGHTLGLMHNFGASSTVPVDSLRNKEYLDKNGFCPSIMDYARFNYVAQPADSIPETDLMPRIGMYDDWAIEWGYKWFPELGTEKDEKAFMDKWITAKLESDKRYWWGPETYYPNNFDPRRLNEDLGDDAINASKLGINNLKIVLNNLIEWTKEPNSDYQSLAEMRDQVSRQFRRYIMHVAASIGGRTITWKSTSQQGDVLQPVSKERQRASIKFLNEQVFDTPQWLMNSNIAKLYAGSGWGETYVLQRDVLERITSGAVFNNLYFFQLNFSKYPGDCYTADELLTDLEANIWKELRTHAPITQFRRVTQKLYLDRLRGILQYRFEQPLDADLGFNIYTDLPGIVKNHLNNLLKLIKQVLPYYKDEITRSHLLEMASRIKKELNPLTGNASSEVQKKYGFSNLDNFGEEKIEIRSCWENN